MSTFATPEPPSLFTMLKSGVVFFTYTTMTETYPKKYNSPDDLVALLIQRGLTITDESIASQYIRNIGYYRLSAYLYPLLDIPKEKQIFKQNSCFGKALELYRFDKKLRLFLFNEIEKIEISFRSSLANIVSEETGNIFWITDSTMFANSSTFYDICILKWFVYVISSENDMKRHLKKLLSDFPSVDVTAMGFPKNWEEEPLWCPLHGNDEGRRKAFLEAMKGVVINKQMRVCQFNTLAFVFNLLSIHTPVYRCQSFQHVPNMTCIHSPVWSS